MPSTFSLVGSVAAASAVLYLVYFDYQRRHSASFRRDLKRRELEHAREKEAVLADARGRLRSDINTLIDASLAASPLPEDLKSREEFFIQEIARADELLNTPDGAQDSALAFYRALVVYPAPEELLGVYEKTIKSERVLDLVRTMIVLRPPPALAAALKSAAAGVADMNIE